jgi:hypothetical protein
MASYYSDPNLQAALLAQAAYEADRQKEGGDQGGGFIDALGKAALIAGAGTAAALGGRRLLRNRAAAGATKQVSVEDLGNIGRDAEETVRRATGRTQAAPAPSQPPPSRPTPGGMIERLGTMEENARIARAERMPGVVQTDLSEISPERARATLNFINDRYNQLLNPSNPSAKEGIQGFFKQSPSYGQLPEVAQEVVSEVKALPPARTTGTDFLANQLSGRGYIEQTVLNRAAEQAAGDLIDEVSAFSNKGARSEIARQAASIQSQERKNLWNLVSDIQNETLVNQQQTTRAFNVDQAINALESGEDQMTGRTMSALQRNEDIDIGTVDRLQDTYEAPLRTQAQPTEALANRQDASVNAVADMLPDGRPLDQAEGIAESSAQRYLTNARNEIASQLGEQNLPISPGRVEQELATRFGKEAWTYGPKQTARRQALELYAQTGDPQLLENIRPQTIQFGSIGELPVSEFKKEVIMPETAVRAEERYQTQVGKAKDWLGNIRVEVSPQLNKLQQEEAILGEQHNMLMYALNKQPDANLAKQFSYISDQLKENRSQQDYLNRRLEGATASTEGKLAGISKQLPTTLADWSGEGMVVKPKLTSSPEFEYEGDVLSSVEGLGTMQAEPIEEELTYVPGGLLTGGRAKSVSNINAFDPETGEPLKMQAASRTSIRGENSGESYSDILSSEDMYGVQRAAMGASSTSPEAAISPSNLPSAWRLPAGSRKQGKQTVNVVVAGGRKYENYPELSQKLDQTISQLNIPEGMSVKIVSGGARGADTLAERYAQERGLGLQVFPANWNEQGLSAGTLRNTQMAKEGDVLVAFPGGSGTENMIRQMAQDFGKPAYRAADMVTQAPTPQKQESFDVARQLRQLQLTGKPGEAQSFLDKMMKQRGVSGAGGTFSTLR